MASTGIGRIALLLCSVGILSACEKGGDFKLFPAKGDRAEVTSSETSANSSVKLIERDVEAPEVFQAEALGLWDGRPSLGGVWVAHPDVTDPERVIIRNEENGKFVIGALFKRERDNPGPPIQVSSDAAAALGMLAGAPDQLSVTALRRQEVPIAQETTETAVEPLPASEEIATAKLDDPVALASAALDKVESSAPVSAPAPTPAPRVTDVVATVAKPTATPEPMPAAKPTRKLFKLSKPFIQVGLFSDEQNAENTGAALRNAGVLPNIRKQTSKGKTFYRVTVGPAPSAQDRAAMLKKVKGLGYNDAYYVTN